jgi:predicted phage terminase large subunit-like protein
MAIPADPRLADPQFLYMIGKLLVHKKAQQQTRQARNALFRPLPDDPEVWLRDTFPRVFQNARGQSVPFAPHHEDFWSWLWALRPGEPARTFIALWGRGAGKSSAIEVGAAVTGIFGLRRYALYVCAGQQQADDHVSNVASLLEQAGVDRALNRYGFSRGWRVNRLRTAEGFTLDAVGLDTAARGVRIDADRPDLILLDDLDNEHDTPLTIEKKIMTLTRAILPTGSAALAVSGVQNIPNVDGIFAQLADGRAEFLLDREVSGPHPVLADIPDTDWWVQEPGPDGVPCIHITQGTPTWEGQDIADCEALIVKIGIRAFQIECLHMTSRLTGTMFQREWFKIVPDWPRQAKLIRWWDFAGTEEKRSGSNIVLNDPDYSVGLLVAYMAGQYWVLDMQRVRLTPKGVEDLVVQTAALDGKKVEIWIGEEPGSSGKSVVEDYQRRVLPGYAVHGKRETGSKTDRAKPASSAAEAGNIMLMAGGWNTVFLDTHGDVVLFPYGAHDDIVDCLSGAVNALHEPDKRAGAWGR